MATSAKNTASTSHATASVSSPPLAVQPAIPYKIDDKPTWTSAWRKGKSAAAGFIQDTDKGYDIISMRNDQRFKAAMTYANGVLSDNRMKMPFFVTDVSIDWSLAGKTAQARLTRDMYPHNFVQPSFLVKGVSLNQEFYGEMCEYIHQAQHDALSGGKLIQLNIVPGKLWPRGGWGRTKGRGVRTGNSVSKIIDSINAVNQSMRGPHKPIVAQGYIGTMQRKHTKGIYVPTWEMKFIVATMLEGPYTEDLVTIKQQQNWVDVVKSVSIFQTAWYVQNDKQNLAWVEQNAPNIFYTPHVDLTSVGTGSGGGGGTGTGSTPGSGIWWKVKASAEDDPPGASASCGPLPADRRGHSVLSVSGLSSDAGTAGQALTPGTLWPCSETMNIYYPKTGKTINGVPHVDNGAGSSFRPAIGIYPTTRQELGGFQSGDEVYIQSSSGKAMNPPNGTQVNFGSGSGGAPSGDAKALAAQILRSGHVSYGRLVKEDLQAAANGQNGSAGVPMDHDILQIIAAVVQSHTVTISALQSGGTGHASGSQHYQGKAADFSVLDGQGITGRNAPAKTIIDIAGRTVSHGGFGQSNCGSASIPSGWTEFSDSCNHLHVDVR